jgi:DNA topoisomerase-1
MITEEGLVSYITNNFDDIIEDVVVLLAKYAPDQPRDSHGRWSVGSGSGVGSEKRSDVMYDARGSGSERTGQDGKPFPKHIAALRIPPAWTGVRYNPDPKAELLVVGTDKRGQSQYIYSEKFKGKNADKKWARTEKLQERYESIYKKNESNRKNKVKEHAECLRLIMDEGIRPGGLKELTSAKKAYGAITLEGKHVVVRDGEVRLQFVGKKGKDLDLLVDNAVMAKILVDRKNRVGNNNRIFSGINEFSLLKYSKSLDRGKFKPKDFRTRLGCEIAQAQVSKMPQPKDEKAYKKAVKAVARIVSEKLGNTPAVALRDYINPAFFGGWRSKLK